MSYCKCMFSVLTKGIFFIFAGVYGHIGRDEVTGDQQYAKVLYASFTGIFHRKRPVLESKLAKTIDY